MTDPDGADVDVDVDVEFDVDALATRYAQVWNEADDEARLEAITQLWTETAVEYISTAVYRGHEQLATRVAQAHQKFVADGGFVFRARDDAAEHHGCAIFSVDMAPAGGGAPAWTGVVFVRLDADRRIAADYQFTR